MEQTRFNELGKTREAENKKFFEYLQTLKNNHAKTKQRKEIEFREQLAKEKEELLRNQRTFDQEKEKYDALQEKEEADAEKEIKIQKEENELIIKELIKEN